MNKNLIFRLLSYLLLLIVPVFWLLNLVLNKTFGWFNLSVACGFVFAGFGLIILTKNAIVERLSAYKRLSLALATIFEVIALVCFVFGFALPKNIIAPIVCIIVAFMLIIALLIAGNGTKWDEGDNHKQGYKNYYERKAEKEKQENANINEQNIKTETKEEKTVNQNTEKEQPQNENNKETIEEKVENSNSEIKEENIEKVEEQNTQTQPNNKNE